MVIEFEVKDDRNPLFYPDQSKIIAETNTKSMIIGNEEHMRVKWQANVARHFCGITKKKCQPNIVS